MTAKKTQTQVKRERYAALLVGTQLMEAAVRDAAKADGVPLPAGNVLSKQWKSMFSDGTGGGFVAVQQARPVARRGRPPAEGSPRLCALQGCPKSNRTKGYCAAHYQKLRMLEKTGRRPDTWIDFPTPGSLPDVKLPRGRAGSKALAEARAAQDAKTKAPKAKKGARA